MSSILDQIMASKRREIETARHRVSERELEHRLTELEPTRGFATALRRPGAIRIIAEVKKASPSAGILRADFDPVAVARTYERHGADALSVLTDEPYFQGSLDYLRAIRQEVGCPLLRKDFHLDRYQLLEARCAGADAVLLIAEILPGNRLAEMYRDATALGLDVLIELHDAAELPRVLATGAALIGINNRDLHTFTTRLEHTLELLPSIPRSVTVVSESGIRTRADLDRLEAAGVGAVLVGESLMRAPDIGTALDALRGVTS